jgi:hypothetical protein
MASTIRIITEAQTNEASVLADPFAVMDESKGQRTDFIPLDALRYSLS